MTATSPKTQNRERSPVVGERRELARVRERVLSWRFLSARSSGATASRTARSRMEQCVEVFGGPSQVVQRECTTAEDSGARI